MEIKRRTFLGGIGAAVAATALPAKSAKAEAHPTKSYATLIDLTKCDGCPNEGTPACVAACRTENQDRFPEPDPAMLKDYWPQKKHEDWSKKRHLTNMLTPYNWLFVQKVKVEHEGEVIEQNIPRRCMHCDNPPCVNLCPFGALEKAKTGPVSINDEICMGGAKCRVVCPWDIPQRQAGVGIYKLIDPIPAGGGAMYKCDLCADRLDKGEIPACMNACPNNAMMIAPRQEVMAHAEKLKEEYNGYLYGKDENGGTSTIYVSKVPFEKISKSIDKMAQKSKKPKKVTRMKPMAKNIVEEHSNLTGLAMLAPVAGAIGAFAATVSKKEGKDNE